MIVRPTIVNVNPLDDLQAAIDATPAGGILRLGPGLFTCPVESGFLITNPITIEGAGVGSQSGSWGTTVVGTGTKDSVVFHIDHVNSVTLTRMCIGQLATPATKGVGHGIWVDNDADTSSTNGLRLVELTVTGCGGNGVFLNGNLSADGSINSSWNESVRISSCRGDGFRAEACAAVTMHNVYVSACGENGISIVNCPMPRLYGCYVEANCADYSVQQYVAGQIYMVSSHGAVVSCTGFETFYGNSNCLYGICLNECYSAVIENCYFQNGVSELNTVSIVMLANTRGGRIGPNSHKLVAYTVQADDDSGVQGMIIEPQVVLDYDATCPGYINMPTTIPQINPDNSAAEGIFNLVYRSQATIWAGSPGNYRIVGLQLPILADIGDTVSGSARGMVSYDNNQNALIYRNQDEWKTLTEDAIVSAAVTYNDALVFYDGEVVTY